MVKQFIKGLLGKKEEKAAGKEEKSTEEVPDELPPLVEDTLKKEEEKPAESKEKPTETKGKESAKEEEDDDLLREFRKYKEEFKEKEGKPQEKEEAAEKEEEEPQVESEEELQPAVKEQKAEKKDTPPLIEQHKLEKEEERGFFSELLSITKEQGINESILKQDLFKRMKDHWYFYPQEKGKFKNREKLQQDLFDELSQLKRLEERWIAQKKFIEEDKRILLEKEREIEAKTEELQKVLNQLNFYKDAPSDNYFWLNNGMVAKNLHELMGLLEVIDDKTFYHHVKDKKNDFSHWIKNVVRNEELAKKVNFAKTRKEALVILENASMGDIYGIGPENYFNLNNGGVIKDIKELLFALKEIDDKTFKSHVNEKRNDFSFWIRDVFKNDYLADRLQLVGSKEGTIKILEDFYKV